MNANQKSKRTQRTYVNSICNRKANERKDINKAAKLIEQKRKNAITLKMQTQKEKTVITVR